MEGQIIGYKQARHHTTGNQMIIRVKGVEKREDALKLVGKKVAWKSKKAEIKGEVRNAHGNKGAMRVLFERGMPGQSIGQKVKVE